MKELATYTPLIPAFWFMLQDRELKEKLKAEFIQNSLDKYKTENGVEGIATVVDENLGVIRIEPRCEHNQ